MNNYSNDYLSQYRNDMEKQAIEQAQNFLRRYGLLPPSYPVTQNNAGDIITIPVTAVEQARNAPIDGFRSFLYPNLDNNEIYVKKTDSEGKETLTVFIPKGMDAQNSKAMDTVTGMLTGIEERLARIEAKKGNKDNG